MAEATKQLLYTVYMRVLAWSLFKRFPYLSAKMFDNWRPYLQVCHTGLDSDNLFVLGSQPSCPEPDPPNSHDLCWNLALDTLPWCKMNYQQVQLMAPAFILVTSSFLWLAFMHVLTFFKLLVFQFMLINPFRQLALRKIYVSCFTCCVCIVYENGLWQDITQEENKHSSSRLQQVWNSYARSI